MNKCMSDSMRVDFNTESYGYLTGSRFISSKEFNRNYVMRSKRLRKALTLFEIQSIYGIFGLERILKYADKSLKDNCKVAVCGDIVYIHFK